MATDKDKRYSMLNFGDGDILLPEPDGSIDAGDRAHLLGLYSGITFLGAALLNFRIKLGAVVLLATGNLTPPTTAVDQPWEIDGDFTVRSIGATGTIMANGRYDNAQTKGLLANTGAKTIDTTVSNDINVSVEWAVANALNIATIQELTIEKRH